MASNPVQLDRLCSILAPAVTRDADGGPVSTFATWKPRLWCRRVDKGGNETRTSSALRGEADAVFTLRWFAGLTEAHRIVNDGRTWDIRATSELGRREWLMVAASVRNGQ